MDVYFLGWTQCACEYLMRILSSLKSMRELFPSDILKIIANILQQEVDFAFQTQKDLSNDWNTTN